MNAQTGHKYNVLQPQPYRHIGGRRAARGGETAVRRRDNRSPGDVWHGRIFDIVVRSYRSEHPLPPRKT